MPFDGNPAKFTETKHDLSRPSLEALSYALRCLSEILPGYHYAHAHFANPCGTAGCAYGVCQMIWPEQFPRNIAAPNGWPRACAAQHFGPGAYRRFFHGNAYGKATESVTERDVADAIDRYLAERT